MVTNLAKIQFCGDGNRCLTNRCRQIAMQHGVQQVSLGFLITGKPLSRKGDMDFAGMGQGLPLLTSPGRRRKRESRETGKYFVMIRTIADSADRRLKPPSRNAPA
ncbi:hypothetical protein BCEN4_560017 [Burkholderia cenocepacia]|nr:hypothetical protein BCEN4_560017 [Burkholderia cenocepacia]